MTQNDILVWLNQTETLRTTEAIPELPLLEDSTMIEQVVHGVHEAVVAYVAAHPGRISRFAARATVDMYRALSRHDARELAIRLAVTIGEIEQNELDAIDPEIRRAMGEAERFLAHGATAVKERRC